MRNMHRKAALSAAILLSAMSAMAQTEQTAQTEHPSLLDNWYVQTGIDMSLQNPYSKRFSKVFPNGKSFGLDVALGRWFTPQLGLRAKVNWENGIPLLENHHANWLAPFYEPGRNMDKGGYLCVVGDIQLDVCNLISTDVSDRPWSAIIFPRAGIAYNCGVEKGTPLLGIGAGATYRLTDRISLYGDAAYNMVSSGFTGHSSTGTGTGSNSNGFFDINIGVQFSLGKANSKERPVSGETLAGQSPSSQSFWENTFVQAGLDMSLQNPYGKDFAQVFPKGKTFGFAAAVGKWFSPEIGLRLRAKWENGFRPFENHHLEWMGPFGRNGINMDEGGYVALHCDVQLSLSNMLGGWDTTRRWNAIVFPRAGLISNLATESASPLVGAGFGTTYRLNDRLSLYSDAAYQVSTSEFFDSESTTGMGVSTGSNGMFDIHVGIQYNF